MFRSIKLIDPPDPQAPVAGRRWLRWIPGIALAVGFAAAGSQAAFAQICQVCVVTIQQVSSNRYVDAHQTDAEDYRLVTRAAQNNTTQMWRLTHLGNNTYTIQQVSSGRYVDAHENTEQDYRLVTRTAQNNSTQRWFFSSLGSNRFTIQQVSNGRFVDAHEVAEQDYRLVTRAAQNNDTQRWRVVVVFNEGLPPPPPPPPPAVVFSQGNFELAPTFRVNLDNGQVGQAGADLWSQPINLADLQLGPVNGAQISYTNGAQRGFLGCLAAAYSPNPVPVASVPIGGYVCLRTSDGRFTEFRINAITPVFRVLSISYVTWLAP